MAYSELSDRVATCPTCQADNVLIGSELVSGTEICCSQCGARIGRWSDTRDRYVGSEPYSETGGDLRQ